MGDYNCMRETMQEKGIGIGSCNNHRLYPSLDILRYII